MKDFVARGFVKDGEAPLEAAAQRLIKTKSMFFTLLEVTTQTHKPPSFQNISWSKYFARAAASNEFDQELIGKCAQKGIESPTLETFLNQQAKILILP